MKAPQWIAAIAGIVLVTTLFLFGRTVPAKKKQPTPVQANIIPELVTDSVLAHAKERLNPSQVLYVNELENSVVRGDVISQKLAVYHQLAHFWSDTARVFEPYAWYEAEAARLENSEKNLNFAAHLFLENLRTEGNPALKRWKAFQAKDLFERSLKIDPKNDSARVGLGATLLFGNISDMPMEGIRLIREVLSEDSTDSYALMTLAHGSLLSGQYDRAVEYFEKIISQRPDDLEALLLLAETQERLGNNDEAVKWYTRSLQYLPQAEIRAEVQNRIDQLKN